MIKSIRSHSQQLFSPDFDSPHDLVSWMGAIQAQDYSMMKWAVGIRLKSPTLKAVDEALAKGEILRTHVMRPTWHLVPAEDIRWMLKLTEKRLTSVSKLYGKHHDLESSDYVKCNRLFEKILEGNRHLTKEELWQELNAQGLKVAKEQMGCYLLQGETEGVLCSGADKGKKVTYTLLEERAPKGKTLTKDEALALLARRYFRSHSPASVADFVWWAGLSLTEARHAIDLVKGELIVDKINDKELIVHQSYKDGITIDREMVHLLPSFDEYIISYKDRTDVLPLEYQAHAFNAYGTFYPIIMHRGMVVGRWKREVKKGGVEIETMFFDPKLTVNEGLIEEAKERYMSFWGVGITPRPTII